MSTSMDLTRYKEIAKLTNRYGKQLGRLSADGIQTNCIEKAVDGAVSNLTRAMTSALVIYGDPQSGKTEMMICLTAKLLDEGHKFIVHLMNDSVDLLSQNLKRFRASGLAPVARTSSELLVSAPIKTKKLPELVVFCKKNSRDLEKLIDRVKDLGKIVVIDDEADYATPNSKINVGKKTPINDLIGQLIGKHGFYIGVTATPARLDLNNTFNNDTEKWVNFPPHSKYTGQDTFFPIDHNVAYRLKLLEQSGTAKEAQEALARFVVTVAYLNVCVNERENNYCMLVHTSGRKLDHEVDRGAIEDTVHSLLSSQSKDFDNLVLMVRNIAIKLYPEADPDKLTEYVVSNASRTTLVVLNSERDRTAAGDSATEPTSPFTIIIGGNIVSRGVTFPNLLSMFFTRNVKHKLQQDTYIQRARMFGARGHYLKHFELTIPKQLYSDWHRCFIFHRLALATIANIGSPVWIGDKRIAVASSTSVDKATVVVDKGEMSFGPFQYSSELDLIVGRNQRSIKTLRELRTEIGNDALPEFLIDYIEAVSKNTPTLLAIHTASSIAGYKDANQESLSRRKGFIGKTQLEEGKFPGAEHHIKILHNGQGNAKVFYKCRGSLQFVQNTSAQIEFNFPR